MEKSNSTNFGRINVSLQENNPLAISMIATTEAAKNS